MSAIKVFDPAMCCTTGVCGPDADDALAQFAGVLERAKKNGVVVDRYSLTHQPSEYVANTQVKSLLDSDGVDCLPMVFIDDELITKGGYPSPAELLGKLGLDASEATGESISGCCGSNQDTRSSGSCGSKQNTRSNSCCG